MDQMNIVNHEVSMATLFVFWRLDVCADKGWLTPTNLGTEKGHILAESYYEANGAPEVAAIRSILAMLIQDGTLIGDVKEYFILIQSSLKSEV